MTTPDMPEEASQPTPEPSAGSGATPMPEPSAGGGAAPMPEPSAGAGAAPMPDAKAAMDPARFGTPQGMVALGAFILIGVEVVFGLILDDFYISTTALLFAVVAALVFLGRSKTASKLASIAVVMKALGYLLAILGVFALVYDLRYASSALNEFTEIIGALAAYGGFALAFMGARSIET